MRKVTITYNTFNPQKIESVTGFLIANKYSFSVDFRHNTTIDTHVSDEDAERLPDMFGASAYIEINPTSKELEPKVKELLQGSDEDEPKDINYPVHIIRDGCEGEYYDDIVSVFLEDDDINCDCAYSTIYAYQLTEDERVELYKEIIDEYGN